MSIVKRKDILGRVYYINTATGGRSNEASYKRSKTAKKTLAPFMARSGKPSKAYCVVVATKLQASEKGTKKASKLGTELRSCGPKVTNKKGYNKYKSRP
jgi:hypothetical protein